jgi:hypothetical protein
MSWKRMGAHLKRLRRNIYPACPDVNSLIDLLHNNADIRKTFGEYRGQTFYRDTIIMEDGKEFICIFAVEQLLKKLPKRCCLNADGTFGILALGFAQLYIIMGTIDGNIHHIFK